MNTMIKVPGISLKLDHVTMKDGATDDPNANNDKGGAIHVESSNAILTITNARFIDNTASDVVNGYGGAIYSNGVMTLEKVYFDGNSASQGGAITSNANPFMGHAAVIKYVDFKSNSVTTNKGGAIYVAAGSIKVRNSNFRQNTAVTNGEIRHHIYSYTTATAAVNAKKNYWNNPTVASDGNLSGVNTLEQLSAKVDFVFDPPAQVPPCGTRDRQVCSPIPTPTMTLTPTIVPCSVGLTYDGSGAFGLSLRESPTRYSPLLGTIPWSSTVHATYKLLIGNDVWYYITSFDGDGWIAARIGGTSYVDNVECDIPAPYPADWPAIAQIEPNELVPNCDIDAYLRSEPTSLSLARIAFAESAIFNQTFNGNAIGGTVYGDALRIGWVVRLDAFLGLPNYSSQVAGRSVSVIDQILNPGSFEPVTSLRASLASNGCIPSGIPQPNVRKMVFPSNSTDAVELYQLWEIYQAIEDQVIASNWLDVILLDVDQTYALDGYEQFKGVLATDACPSGADGLVRPGPGLPWAANQPFPPKPVRAYRDEIFGEAQLNVTCYQDVYHLDDWLWAILRDEPNWLSNPATSTFPEEHCVTILVNPANPQDFYPLAQLTGLDGQPWPNPQSPCNPEP